jgi:hypothetical protein
MTTISLRCGSEGPRHDPYHFNELTVEGRNGTTTLHLGLAVWCKNDKLKLRVDNDEAFKLFERCVGVSSEVAHKAYEYKEYVLPYKLHSLKCDAAMENVHGFPGETFDHCPKCGATAGYHFNRSAIE